VQTTGRVTLKLGSEQLSTKPGAVLQPGGINRDFDMTDQLQSYYKEKGVPAMMRGTIVHATETDLIKLRNWKNGTAFYETDTDHVYTIANASIVSVGDLANGEVEVTIMGDPATE